MVEELLALMVSLPDGLPVLVDLQLQERHMLPGAAVYRLGRDEEEPVSGIFFVKRVSA